MSFSFLSLPDRSIFRSVISTGALSETQSAIDLEASEDEERARARERGTIANTDADRGERGGRGARDTSRD